MNGPGVPIGSGGRRLKRRALVVDDNALLAHFTAKNLERDVENLEVVTANSCRQARELAAGHPFAVIVVDLNLGDGNGLDLIKEINRGQPGTAAVLISGNTMPDSELPALFAALVKPYEAFELAQVVTSALEHASPGGASSRDDGDAVECAGYDRHKAENQLGALLAGLRAFGKDLQSAGADPRAVQATVDQYLDHLCSLVLEVSRLLPNCRPQRDGHVLDNSPQRQTGGT